MTTHSLHPSVTLSRVTHPPGHHYFGYYDKSPWDPTYRWILGMRTQFIDRPPNGNDELTLGRIDTANGNQWLPFDSTTAWNWQQGCMLQWLGNSADSEVIFNARENDRFVSKIHNFQTGSERILPMPVYAVHPAGESALCINFSRLHHQRPGYGYPGIEDPWRSMDSPRDDGIYALDLKTGQSKLIISLADIAAIRPSPAFAGRMHRFNHLQFSPNGERFIFLHRYKLPAEPVGITRLFTSKSDGSDLHLLSDHGMVSHFDWCGNDAVIAWASQDGTGEHFYKFSDRNQSVEIIGKNTLDCDGHCSLSSDGQWMLTDSYPDAENFRTLILFNMKSAERTIIGRFFAPPNDWELRCDLHPRWRKDSRQVCIDSMHEGMRQMYVLNIEKLTTPKS